MASRFCKLFIGDINFIKLSFVRNASKRRLGLPPEKARSLKQRLEEMNFKDPKISYKVDIGLPKVIQSRSKRINETLLLYKKNRRDPHLEKLSRENKLVIPLEDITDSWYTENAPYHIKETAEHYGIFQDLFGDAYFYPQVILDITYSSEDFLIPVYRGNVLKPVQTRSAPAVKFNAEPNTLWTLLLTNPDGHFTQQDAEYVHWFVGNIPGGDVNKGDLIVDYLQPFPARGTGYHRYIFVLYKQEGKIDYSKLQKQSPCLQLHDRTFHTYDFFYRDHQDRLTPAGLSFFQSDWDQSLTDFFHNTLEMEEPVFEYDFPEPYHPKQKWFPLRQPFNLYMDRYRDPKQIAKEYLLKKLKQRHPFEKPKPPLRFPNAVRFTTDKHNRPPSWLKLEMRKERLGWGRINDF